MPASLLNESNEVDNMSKKCVGVLCEFKTDGTCIPRSVRWHDDSEWPIKKVTHVCTSPDEFEGIRYTVIIGSAERYLFKVDNRWYVDSTG